MADVTGYTLLKNTTKKTCQMNAIFKVASIDSKGEYWLKVGFTCHSS